jgi:hypothetical protein
MIDIAQWCHADEPGNPANINAELGVFLMSLAEKFFYRHYEKIPTNIILSTNKKDFIAEVSTFETSVKIKLSHPAAIRLQAFIAQYTDLQSQDGHAA